MIRSFQPACRESMALLPFSSNEEAALAIYLIMASNMYYGLTELEARKLVYQYVLANSKKVPQAWIEYEKAKKEWMYQFQLKPSIIAEETRGNQPQSGKQLQFIQCEPVFLETCPLFLKKTTSLHLISIM